MLCLEEEEEEEEEEKKKPVLLCWHCFGWMITASTAVLSLYLHWRDKASIAGPEKQWKAIGQRFESNLTAIGK